MKTNHPPKRMPPQFWIGLLLVSVAWPLNWFLPGIRTHILFFFLWIGYALVVDGLVFLRKKTSLLTRSRVQFITLLPISVVSWWIFEFVNETFTHNWVYIGREYFTDTTHFLFGSLCFSTVMPAVFGTAELIGSFRSIQQLPPGPIIKPTPLVATLFYISGWLMLVLLIAYPHYFYPFLWISIYFILEPISLWLDRPTLASYTAKGNWSPVVALWIGVLITGIFWEGWNELSFPRWEYSTPGVNFFKIFRLELIGYGGYLPFALELFSLYQLLAACLPHYSRDYIQITSQPVIQQPPASLLAEQHSVPTPSI